MLTLGHMLPLFRAHFSVVSHLSLLMILILMDVFQCEMSHPGVNADQPVFTFGERPCLSAEVCASVI